MTGSLYVSRPALVSACGIGLDDLWRYVSAADNSVMRPVRTEYGDKEFCAATVACPLPPSPLPRYPDTKLFRMVASALRELSGIVALAVSGYGAGRVGVCVGGCDNGSELSVSAHRQYLEGGSFPDGYRLEMQGAGYVADYIKDFFSLGGPATATSTACSSSSTALVRAAEMIRGGICDAVIAGGADIVSDMELLGFDAMECVAPSPTNPFSGNRAGITLGEAAVFFLVSREPLHTDGGEPSVRLAGYGESSDAFHITSPDPGADGAVAAMRQALASAGMGAAQVDLVNLHGTGTLSGDAMEARAVSAVFGPDVPCVASKSVTGHTLGAAGAMSLAVCYAALVKNALPAQAWDGQYDSSFPPIRIVGAGEMADGRPVRCCMSNSFGFGGVNVSLILCKDEDG